ncbi:MAG TPA: glycosyltransferase family 4 protein [Candidatus Acidoferrales bacterium]|nr:glycosyltransferase family 4 protein [Candidatus Acidoferrales bacterium]
MRILHVVRRFDPLVGGTERYVGDLARAQAAAGQDVTVATLDHDVAGVRRGHLPALETVAGVRVVRLPGFGSGRFALTLRPDRLLRLVRRTDVVHLHDLRFQVGTVALANRLRGRTTFLHTHGLVFGTPAWRRLKLLAFRLWYQPLIRGAGIRVLCSSRADLELLREVAPRAAMTATVLDNGVALGPFLAVERDPEVGRVVIVGRVAPGKGIEAAIRALARVAGPAWSLHVHGAGVAGEIDRLRSVASALGVADRIAFAGSFEPADEAAIYRAATLALLPSESEGFGIALLDAMAAGVPVAARDIPAHRQLLGEEGASLLLDLHDPVRWVPTLESLLRLPPEEARRLGDRLRERARAYDVGRLVEDLEALYRELGVRRSA